MIGPDNLSKQNNRKFILPLVLIAAFLLLYALTGYKVHVDSYQYMDMHIRRDPVYPLFLFILRSLFGEGTAYLHAAGFVQSVVNALGVCFFASSLTRLFGQKTWFLWTSIFFACIPYALTGIFSLTKIQLAADILSESLTYPLFLCIFVFLLKILVQTQKRTFRDPDVWISFLLILLITLVRGQVMALIVVWMLAVLYRIVRESFLSPKTQPIQEYSQETETSNTATSNTEISNTATESAEGSDTDAFKRLSAARKKSRGIGGFTIGVFIVLAAIVCFFAGRTALLKSYGLLIVSRYETHPNLANFALSHVLYVSDRADADKVPDTKIADAVKNDYGNELPDLTLRELFLRMCDKMEEMRWNMAYESGSFFERSAYMDSCNDPVKFQVIEDTYVAYVKPFVPDYNYLDLIENDISATMMKALLPEVITSWLVMYARHVFFGLIRSIGLATPLLTPVFVLLYAVAVFMMVRAFRSALHGSGDVTVLSARNVSPFAMALSLVIIAGFATSISLMHFCISRYMFYSFPCFYVSFAGLLVSSFSKRTRVE